MTSKKPPQSDSKKISFLKWVIWFSLSVHFPLWTYAVVEVLQGNIEPLLGGPFENLIAMFGMSTFYAGFFLGPSLLFAGKSKQNLRKPQSLGKKEALLLGVFGGLLLLFCVHRLPLNGLEPWAVGSLLVLSGALSASAIHVVGSVLLTQKSSEA
ncbi:MAG: hypothetical protein GY822_26885 [Deltaproteobacteria bacterium]|nr:hypothetical protein [Deltaproteobacteria bacterium]